jgi:hypothetical protein
VRERIRRNPLWKLKIMSWGLNIPTQSMSRLIRLRFVFERFTTSIVCRQKALPNWYIVTKRLTITSQYICKPTPWSICVVESGWNVMAYGDAGEGKWRGNWRMEWVGSTLHTTSERGVSSITTDDTHTSAASSRLNWRPRRFKWTCPFRRKKKSGFCACAITFQ